MSVLKRILIKMSGEVFTRTSSHSFDPELVAPVIEQVKNLHQKCHVSLLIGGGNFFRGEQHGNQLGLELATGHTIGMVATMMNGLILQELLTKAGVDSVMINSFSCPSLAEPLNKKSLQKAIDRKQVIIFTGGTGNPYFTTDTAAVIRSLQVGADEMWKATKVDGVYDRPPTKDVDAKLLKKVTYEDVLAQRLQIMDLTAITLAQKHHMRIRVFNMFTPDALQKAYDDENFASLISE